MKIGEVCLETNNVIALADFYRKILNIEGDCKDEVHQFILTEEQYLRFIMMEQ